MTKRDYFYLKNELYLLQLQENKSLKTKTTRTTGKPVKTNSHSTNFKNLIQPPLLAIRMKDKKMI